MALLLLAVFPLPLGCSGEDTAGPHGAMNPAPPMEGTAGSTPMPSGNAGQTPVEPTPPGSGMGGSGAMPPQPPSDPGVPISELTLAVVPANTTVGLEWPIIEGAASYNLYWATAPGVTPQTGTKIENAIRGFVHRGLENGATYYYVVTAITAAGESEPSAEASATPSGEWILEQLGTGDPDNILTGERLPTVPIEQRFHILLFGEGYPADNLGDLHDNASHDDERDNDVDRWIDQVFDIEPYSFFPEAFVVWFLSRPSNTTIRDATPDTAYQVPVEVGSGFPAMGSVQRDGETASIAWQAIGAHPYAPPRFDRGDSGSALNFVASFMIFDPDRGRASVSGRATSLSNPDNSDQRIRSAFGVGHHHEFTHAFSNLRDEYMENNNDAPSRWASTANVVGSNVCSELPWEHLLMGSQINPDVDNLVGAFGHPDRGFHSELLCMMNGTHENGEYFARDDAGACEPDDCTLRVETRMCNFCREMTAFRIFERTGVLAAGEDGFDVWTSQYRMPFYDRFEFQVPGVHFEGLLPQSNDRRNPEEGTQIFQACVP